MAQIDIEALNSGFRKPEDVEAYIADYLENAAKRDELWRLQDEQMAKDIVKGMNENKCSAPTFQTSDAEWAQLQRDIARGDVLR